MMAKLPPGSLISVMQNFFFASSSSTTLPTPSKKANLPAALLLKPPPSLSAVQSSESASESALSISKWIPSEEKKTEFFNLFRVYGFEDPQIQKLIDCGIARYTNRNLQPKLDFLVENGFKGMLLLELLTSCPFILCSSLEITIKPRFQFLKEYLESDEKVVNVISKAKWILTINAKLSFMPNIEFLINEGVPVNRISLLLASQPTALLQSRDRMAYIVKTLREYGAAPEDPMFIYSLRVVCGLSESTLKKKMELLNSFGWSDEQTSIILLKRPSILNLSEEKLRSRIDFLINTIKLEPEIVIRHPFLITHSEERIRARYEVLKILKSKKISNVKLTSVAPIAEGNFLKNYVVKHLEAVPGLLDMYNAIANERK